MDTQVTDFARLSLLIQRLLDADVLYDTEGVTLLTETAAARCCLEEGNAKAARRHLEQVAYFTETLVSANALFLADGRAILETARHLLG